MNTWILIRGLTREAGHWGHFAAALQRALPPGSTLLTPDLPGNGQLHGQRSPGSVHEMVEALRATLAAQGLAGPYNVVAMSLGAMVTVAWSQTYPDELRRTVLINTSLRPFSPFWHRLRPANYPLILGLLLRRASAQTWERAIMQMTTRHPPEPAATLQHWVALRAAHPVTVANGLRQLWAASRYRAEDQAPKVPMLMLNSLGDRLVHPDCSAAVAKAWGLPLIRHPTAGHDLPLDATSWVVAQIQAWLESPAPSPAPHPAPPADPESVR
jgi:pimeloyl-ACP methyl ester carboxylesterase